MVEVSIEGKIKIETQMDPNCGSPFIYIGDKYLLDWLEANVEMDDENYPLETHSIKKIRIKIEEVD